MWKSLNFGKFNPTTHDLNPAPNSCHRSVGPLPFLVFIFGGLRHFAYKKSAAPSLQCLAALQCLGVAPSPAVRT